MKYGCRTRTLCLEEGPPRWPPSSGECSLLVPLPEPARDPPAREWPRWKAAAECHDSLVLQCAWPIETHLAVVSTLPNSLLREPVSQDWSLVYLELLARCQGQGTAALAALETPKRGRRASQLCYVSGRKRLREVLAGDCCALQHWQG